MGRLVTNADIVLYGPGIIANGQKTMEENDWIIFLSERAANGNVFQDRAMTARLGGTIWIEGGRGPDDLGYGAIHLGENFPHSTSSTAINTSTLVEGGTVVLTVPTGQSFPVGHKVRVRGTADNSNNFVGYVQSYSGSTLTLEDLFMINPVAASVSSWQLIVELIRSDVDNPVHVHFFGGQGIMDYNGTRGSQIEIWNIDYLVADFETNSHPGMRDGWGSGRGGTFGILMNSATFEHSDMGLKIDNALGTAKRWYIRGVEVGAGGFAHLRVSLAVNVFEEIVFERCWLHESFRGEGSYIGLTSATGPWPIHKALKYKNVLMTFTGAESIQAQQCGEGSVLSHNVIFGADHDRRTAFQSDQDTCCQIDMVHGNVTFKNNVLDYFGKNGIHLFGKDASAQGHPFGTDRPQIENNAVGGTKRQISFRCDGSMGSSGADSAGVDIIDLDIYGTRRMYDDIGPNRDYHMEMAGDNPVDQWGGNVYDDAYDIHADNDDFVRYFNVTRDEVPRPEYVNSGFDGIDVDRITRWYEAYYINTHTAFHQNATTSITSIDPSTLTIGNPLVVALRNTDTTFAPGTLMKVYLEDGSKYIYGTVASQAGANLTITVTEKLGSGATAFWFVGARIPYTTEDFVWLMVHQGTAVSTPVALYKCILNHTAHRTQRPDLDESRWEKVWWDVNGKNQYDPLYNGVPFTTDYTTVAGDFRLVKGSYHHLLERGLECNEQREDQSKYGWQWKETEAGTIRDIPGAYSDKLVVADWSYLRTGRYFRGWVEALNSSGTFQTRTYSAWQVI